MQELINNVKALQNEATAGIEQAQDLNALNDIRVHYFGKKGQFTEILKNLKDFSAEDKPKVGQIVNEVKAEVQKLLNRKIEHVERKNLEHKLMAEQIDVTLPGRGVKTGTLHPVAQVRDRITQIFQSMGFIVETGPEIETDYYNFEALNIPETHPARAMHDTFYIDNEHVLRTHTTPVQARYLATKPLPVKMIAVGRVYRCDFDVTHTPMFHQLEGLLVDENVSFADLKGLLIEFLRIFFEEEDLQVRFRPSYFPFTEPSAEVDMQCVLCHGEGCRVCGHSGWLEVLGCGMVHPNVFKQAKIDAEKYTGYAFGMGIDRLTMLYYGLDDLRALFENDIRFLKQF